jgi:hypothetical protein
MFAWLLLSGLLFMQDPGYVPVASVAEIMQVFIVPSSNEVFNVGIEFPETDEGWKAVERNALILAESGNLLLVPERAQERQGWIEAARTMTGAARASLEAARARSTDPDAWFTLSDEVLASCTSCHETYWIVD